MRRAITGVGGHAAPAATAAVRHAHPPRGFEHAGDKADPFGERAAWDSETAFGKWRHVDVEALAATMEDTDIQKMHFGPDWARVKTIARAASKRMAENPGQTPRKASERAVGLDGSDVSATQSSAKWTPNVLSKLPQTYEEMVAIENEQEGAAADDEADVPASLRVDGPDRAAVAAEVGAQALLSRLDAAADNGKGCDAAPSATAAAPTASASCAAGQPASPNPAAAAAAEADAAAGISPREPLEWTTEEVVAWLRRYGGIDDDMASAFEMVRVDGRMLLDIMPCDMFKEMRRWHNRGRLTAPKVTELLLQETIYNCYPYGK